MRDLSRAKRIVILARDLRPDDRDAPDAWRAGFFDHFPEAFVYLWRNEANGTLYVGYHLGWEDDGYVCSSFPMAEAYALDPSAFHREILSRGTRHEMKLLESLLLSRLDAARSPRFYNRSNGFLEYDLRIVREIDERTDSPAYRKLAESLDLPSLGMRSEKYARDELERIEPIVLDT